MTHRHAQFALGDEKQARYAMQLRITPQMLTAIRSSSAALAAAGTLQQQQHSIQLDGASNKAVSSMSDNISEKSIPNSIKWKIVTRSIYLFLLYFFAGCDSQR
jgi:hypothetical protein